MSNYSLVFLSAAALVLSHPALAAVFSRDWKAPGDGLLTYDDVNQREWLDLSATSLIQFPGATRLDRYLHVIGQLTPGGIFDGFEVGLTADVTAFADSAGIDTRTRDFATNVESTRALISKLSATIEVTPYRVFSIGLMEIVGGPPRFGRNGAVFYVDENSGPAGDAGLLIGDSDLLSELNVGVMLYRNVIPEPNAQILGFTYALFMAVFLPPERRRSMAA